MRDNEMSRVIAGTGFAWLMHLLGFVITFCIDCLAKDTDEGWNGSESIKK